MRVPAAVSGLDVLMRITEMAHEVIGCVLQPGDVAIDATAGNGQDTIFLADRVGEKGRVLALDVQEAALAVARGRVGEAGWADRVILVHASHEQLRSVVERSLPGRRVRAVLFNLGYLPGGDKMVTTRAATTLVALRAAMEVLGEGGVIVVVLYPGHSEGAREAEALERWAQTLPAPWVAVQTRLLNRSAQAPRLLVLRKLVGEGKGQG